MKKSQTRFSILSASSRRQMVAAFASMSIIPLLTLVYLLAKYVNLDEAVPTDVLFVVALNLILSLGGMLMLGKILRSLTALHAYMENTASGRAPAELGQAGSEIGLMANAVEAMNRELDVERKWLSDMSSALEDAAKEHAADKLRLAGIVSTVVEACPSPMMVMDAGGKITCANTLAADIFGLSPRQLIGRAHNSEEWRFSDAEGNKPADDDLPFSLARDKGGAVYGVKFQAIRPDGSRATLLANVLPFFDQSATLHGAVMTLDDVAESAE